MCDACENDQSIGIGRRGFLGMAALAAGGSILALKPAMAAADECAAFLGEAQAATSPDHAVQMLVDGNARFVAGTTLHCDELADMRATAEKQTPFACVLGCIDSRTAPELVFDQQIGDLFVGRVAGNVENGGAKLVHGSGGIVLLRAE